MKPYPLRDSRTPTRIQRVRGIRTATESASSRRGGSWWRRSIRMLAVACMLGIPHAGATMPADARLQSKSFGNISEQRLIEQYPALNALMIDGNVIPGLHRNFVPQGVDFLATYPGHAVLSGYFCERFSGRFTHIVRVCLQKRSALYLFDLENGEAVRLALLEEHDGKPMRRHAGGVAELYKRLWLPDNYVLFRFDLSELIHAESEVITLRPENKQRIGVDSRGDYIAAFDGALWIGNFQRGDRGYRWPTHYRSTENRTAGWTAGYRIDPDTLRPASTTQYEVSFAGVTYEVYRPDSALHHRNRVQGISFMDAQRVVLSSSYGRNSSSLAFHELGVNPMNSTDLGTQVTLPDGSMLLVQTLGRLTRSNIIYAPPGAEGVAFDGSLLAVAFEGGAMPYRARWGRIEDRLLMLIPPARRHR